MKIYKPDIIELDQSLVPQASGSTDLGSLSFTFNKGYIDKVYLESDPTTPLQAATKQYVDIQTESRDTFIELNDTPATYASYSASGVRVKATEDGLEFCDIMAYSGYSGYSGISGYSGLSGTKYIWRGSWNSGTAYVINDCVEYNGSGYVSIQNGTNKQPDTETSYWNLLVEGTSGYSGYSGISGYSGYSGISGYSGYSGISGYSGYSGISGYSGYSGISGYSGTDSSNTASITFILDGGGSIITTGEKGWKRSPYSGTLTGWELTAEPSCAVAIDVWKDTYANFPPDNSDSMCNGHEPSISASGIKAQDLDLSDWSTTVITAGDYLKVNVDSNSEAIRVVLELLVTV